MNILALDTSAKTTSVCIASDEQILSEFSVIATQTHSQTLMPMLQSAVQSCGISLKEIDLYAVSNGPGSFTGLRIGIGAIKGVGEKTEKLLHIRLFPSLWFLYVHIMLTIQMLLN